MGNGRTTGARRATTAVVTAVLASVLLTLTAGAQAATGPAEAVGEPSVRRVGAAAAADAPHWHPEGVSDDQHDGLVHAGLADTEDCGGGFEVEGSTGQGRRAQCSHGPDQAPLGIDVRDRPSVDELLAREQAASTSSDGSTAGEPAPVACYGDGTTGKRLHAIYAVAADRVDRYGAVADLVRGYAATADQAFSASAARDGGVRHLRWVTDTSCRLVVDHVVLSPTGDDSLGNTRAELASLGYNRTDRKYVVWSDATVYCGIAYVVGDARPDASNPANIGPTFSRIDSACWGGTASVVAHEIAHMLGAVNLSAPHSNGAWHCTDENDRLCYDDGSGAAMTFLCATSQEPLLDCNGDDYYNVAPVPGSWLATHWNVAASAFLETAEPTLPSPPTALPPPPPPTADPPPAAVPVTPPVTATPPAPPLAPPVTVTRALSRVVSASTGRLTRSTRHRDVRVLTSRGDLTATLHFRGAERLRVTVRAPGGAVVATRVGPSGTQVSARVPSGSYDVVVSGGARAAGARFSLQVARPPA